MPFLLMMKHLILLSAVIVNIVMVSITTIVVTCVGWLLSQFLPTSPFESAALFLGSAFITFYVKRNQGKGRLPEFMPQLDADPDEER